MSSHPKANLQCHYETGRRASSSHSVPLVPFTGILLIQSIYWRVLSDLRGNKLTIDSTPPSKGDRDKAPTAPTNTHSAQFPRLENRGHIYYIKVCRLDEILDSAKHSAWHMVSTRQIVAIVIAMFFITLWCQAMQSIHRNGRLPISTAF